MFKMKELRQKQNLSLRELSECLNIPYSSLGKYERGDQQPSFENLIKIANYFNVSTDYLLGNSIYRNSNEEFTFKKTITANEQLYHLFTKITSSYLHLHKLYSDASFSPYLQSALPMQMIHNLEVISDIYSDIDPQNADSLEELSEEMGHLISTFNLNVETLTLFREIMRLYLNTKEPPTTE